MIKIDDKMRTKQEYLLDLPFEFIIGFSEETGLVRDHACFTKKDFVHRLIGTLTISECHVLSEMYRKGAPYRSSVDWYLAKYPSGEMVSKSFVEHLNKRESNLGSIYFEFPIIKTRVDILRLASDSHAYEVKSERDKVDRLEYQIPALQKVFDYVYLIAPNRLMQKIPDSINSQIGLITFSIDACDYSFELAREPKINYGLNSKLQLNLLRLDELGIICSKIIGAKAKRMGRKEQTLAIIQHYNSEQIHEMFKLIIQSIFIP